MTRNRPDLHVPHALVDEILRVAESVEQSARVARDLLDRLDEHLEGFADWSGPYVADPDRLAEGEARIRGHWGDRYRPVCSCRIPADVEDDRCTRCWGHVT
jgi:hypothetical protein